MVSKARNLLAFLGLLVFAALHEPARAAENAADPKPPMQTEEFGDYREAQSRAMTRYYKGVKDSRAGGKTPSPEDREKLRSEAVGDVSAAQAELIRATLLRAKEDAAAREARLKAVIKKQQAAEPIESGAAESVDFSKPVPGADANFKKP